MKKVLVGLLVPLMLTACNFSKSVKKDFVTGLTASGDGLSCEDIYLSVNDENITRNTFIYGEKVYVNFSDIKGFTKENENAFPGMKIVVTSTTGEIVFQVDDLHAGFDQGVDYSPLLLYADIVVAAPMHSGNEYLLNINIWDKKGIGTFDTSLPFTVKPNEKISIEASDISYNEVYLFSESLDKSITDNKIKFNDNTYVIFEGLDGFSSDNGLIYPGLSLLLTDSKGNQILNNDNLFTEYSENGIDPDAVKERVSAHFNVTGTNANNPLHCVVTMWDTKSNSRIKMETDLVID